MKKAHIYGVLLFLTASLLLPMAGCDEDKEEPVIETPETGRWLELLRILPENDVTLHAAYIQTSEYADILQTLSSETTDAPSAPPVDIMAHSNLPLFLRYSDEEWKTTLGFTIDDVTASVYASAGPPYEYQAVQGTFTREDIEYAAKNGPLHEHCEIDSWGGYEYYRWGEDMSIHMDWRSNVRPLGRGCRLAYIDGCAFWIPWTDGIEEMIDAYKGNIPSLADRADYQLLAAELEKQDTVTAFFSSNTLSIAEFKDMFRTNLEEMEQQGYDKQLEAFENEPLLKHFTSFAAGAGEDAQGTYMVIVLMNPDESTAKANAGLLERRINESQVMPQVKNIDPEENPMTWMDTGRIENIEVTSQGTLTIAKLYGSICTSWDDFNIHGSYKPLPLHE